MRLESIYFPEGDFRPAWVHSVAGTHPPLRVPAEQLLKCTLDLACSHVIGRNSIATVADSYEHHPNASISFGCDYFSTTPKWW